MITSPPPCFTQATQNLYPSETFSILEKLLFHLLPRNDKNETFGVENVLRPEIYFIEIMIYDHRAEESAVAQ